MRNGLTVFLVFVLLIFLFSCSNLTESQIAMVETVKAMTKHITEATLVQLPESNAMVYTQSNEESSSIKTIEITSRGEREMSIDLLQEYSRMIKQFSVDADVGIVENKEDAIKAAEEMWLNKFGDSILEKKPYAAVYDKQNEIWLVHGTLPMYMVGGVPMILIERNGKVLAVWHDK